MAMTGVKWFYLQCIFKLFGSIPDIAVKDYKKINQKMDF